MIVERRSGKYRYGLAIRNKVRQFCLSFLHNVAIMGRVPAYSCLPSIIEGMADTCSEQSARSYAFCLWSLLLFKSSLELSAARWML